MPRVMRKELRPVHDLVECDLCGRTILKGERIEAFVAGGDRRKVCELCTFQALRLGWPRESELDQHAPERTRTRQRRPLWARLTEWAEEQGLLGGAASPEGAEGRGRSREATAPNGRSSARPTVAADAAAPDAPPVHEAASKAKRSEERASLDPNHRAAARYEAEGALGAPLVRRPERAPGGASFKDLLTGRRADYHEVHAVPTSRDGKLELALELFNASEHRRTIAGIARTLGEPWVSAVPVGEAAAAREVTLVVAWELSWYRYRVDLGDADQPVLLLDRGDEIDDLDEALRAWNAGADGDGHLALAVEPVS